VACAAVWDVCQVVKERDYLIDNQSFIIISYMQGSGQEESGPAAEQVPKVGDEKCDGVVGRVGAKRMKSSLTGRSPVPGV
jgi:hypothetical protein